MVLTDAASSDSFHVTFADWVIGFALLGLVVWMYRNYSEQEAKADRDFTDEVAKNHAIEAVLYFSKHWDVGSDPISMDDYWRRQTYWQRQRHLDRVKALFVDFGAIEVKQEDGSVCYRGSLSLRLTAGALIEGKISPREPVTSINIGDGAVAQFGDGNSVGNVSTVATYVVRIVEENREVVDSLVEALARLAAATEACEEHRSEAAVLSKELSTAQRQDPEAVPTLARRVRTLLKGVGSTAANLAPLVSVMNGFLDVLQKAGLHV